MHHEGERAIRGMRKLMENDGGYDGEEDSVGSSQGGLCALALKYSRDNMPSTHLVSGL